MSGFGLGEKRKNDNQNNQTRKPSVKAQIEKSNRKAQPATISASTNPTLPSHMVLTKGPHLRESAKEMSRRKDKLEEEFRLIAEHTKANVTEESSISRLDENKIHNRYLDIGRCSCSGMNVS